MNKVGFFQESQQALHSILMTTVSLYHFSEEHIQKSHTKTSHILGRPKNKECICTTCEETK